MRVLGRGIALSQFLLGGVVICLWDYLQSSHSICSDIHQWNHALYAMEATFVDRVLIHMQVLHEGLPTAL
jgi:hypothetical protein